MIKPKYIDLSKKIKEAIKDGKWQERLPGVFRLAEEYGVDPATVSKALKLLEKEGLVTINGRRGTFISTAPNRKYYKIVGLVGVNYDSRSLNIIKGYFRKYNYKVMAISQNDDLLKSNPEVWCKMPLDGLIFMNSSLTVGLISELRKSGMPFVSANKIIDVPGVTWVDFGTEKGLEDLIRHFYKLGHRRIAFADIYTKQNSFTERLHSVYEKTCRELKCFDESLFYAPETIEELAENFFKMNTEATAIISINRESAIELKEKAATKGLNIPQDLSLACCKADEFDDFFTVSSYQDEKRSLMTAELLLEKIQKPDCEVKQITLKNTLAKGKSSASPAK
jgi:DNA-binding LacI/PurR family transcriptional regulator